MSGTLVIGTYLATQANLAHCERTVRALRSGGITHATTVVDHARSGIVVRVEVPAVDYDRAQGVLCGGAT